MSRRSKIVRRLRKAAPRVLPASVLRLAREAHALATSHSEVWREMALFDAARNRPAWQSSYRTERYANSVAADGSRRNLRFHSTKLEPNPWWMVELEDDWPIHAIRIHNRSDRSAIHSARLIISVSENKQTWQVVHAGVHHFGDAAAPGPLEIRLLGAYGGRYVRAELPGTGMMCMHRIEVLVERRHVALRRACHHYGCRFSEMTALRIPGLAVYSVATPPLSFDGAVKALHVSKRVGRFGNHLKQIAHATSVARRLGIRRVYVMSFPQLEIVEPIEADGVTLLPEAQIKKDRPGATLSGTFYFHQPLGKAMADIQQEDLQWAVDNFARPLFLRKAVPPPLMPTETDLAIHIRSGDIFASRKPNPLYVQPPLAFYRLCIATARERLNLDRVILVYENELNPCIPALKAWLTEISVPFVVQSATLHEDLAVLLHARNCVFGVGTFGRAVAMLSDHMNAVFFWTTERDYPRIARCRHMRAIEVKDSAGGYTRRGEWRASPEQLQLMMDYPIENLALKDKALPSDEGGSPAEAAEPKLQRREPVSIDGISKFLRDVRSNVRSIGSDKSRAIKRWWLLWRARMAAERRRPDLVNVALHCPASQSSVRGNAAHSGPAIGTTGRLGSRRFFATKHEQNPWWVVDLGIAWPIHLIRIYNQPEPDSKFAGLLTVSISQDGQAWSSVLAGVHFFGDAGAPGPLEIRPRSNQPARFVRLELPGTGTLRLRQVEVLVDRPLIDLHAACERYGFDFYNMLPRQGSLPGRLKYRIEGAPKPFDGTVTEFHLRRPVGRFGNHLKTLVLITCLARRLGIKRIYLPSLSQFEIVEPIEADGVTVLPERMRAGDPPGAVLSGPFFVQEAFGDHVKEISDGEDSWAHRNFVDPLFWRTERTPPFLPAETDLAIHIRSGDVFSKPNPHKGYVQPPLSFYQLVVRYAQQTLGIQRVILVSEDEINPCIGALKLWLREIGLPFVAQSGTLEADLALLLRARHCVFGHGSFGPAVVRLSRQMQTVFFPWTMDSFPRIARSSGVRPILVRDLAGKFVKIGDWRNTPEQLRMMLDYPIENLALDEDPEMPAGAFNLAGATTLSPGASAAASVHDEDASSSSE